MAQTEEAAAWAPAARFTFRVAHLLSKAAPSHLIQQQVGMEVKGLAMLAAVEAAFRAPAVSRSSTQLRRVVEVAAVREGMEVMAVPLAPVITAEEEVAAAGPFPMA